MSINDGGKLIYEAPALIPLNGPEAHGDDDECETGASEYFGGYFDCRNGSNATYDCRSGMRNYCDDD